MNRNIYVYKVPKQQKCRKNVEKYNRIIFVQAALFCDFGTGRTLKLSFLEAVRSILLM